MSYQTPSQAGKLAIVTGANSGIGFFTASELAKAGADVILACRSEAKAKPAVANINAAAPGRARFEKLDLASLASVRDFAARMQDQPPVDILINNAGVMALPQRQLTADGFEMQLGVNFLGHFALTARLLPRLREAAAPRVVQLASIAHRQGRIDLRDLQAEHGYKPWAVYNQSKLAMLMFAMELQRRSDSAGWGLTSVAAHPGIARTELVANGPGANGLMAWGLKLGGPFVTQSSEAGAWPTLLAATAPDVTPGGYYGPTGFMEFRGPPGPAKPAGQALDAPVARGLWAAAETLTGEQF
ncbi:MAG: short chain dehydrogenase [Acidocella sp. 20-61-6]|nr:MAG: short chain dehydrogenase [Acidocella sp. 20-61-6]